MPISTPLAIETELPGRDSPARGEAPGRTDATAKLRRLRSQWIERVVLDRNLTDAEFRIGVALAYHLHLGPGPDHGMVWPSAGRLAELLRGGSSTTRRALKRLRECGYIKVAKPGGGRTSGAYKSTYYVLELPKALSPASASDLSRSLASANPLAGEHPSLSLVRANTEKVKLVDETDTLALATDKARAFLNDDVFGDDIAKRFAEFWDAFPAQRRAAKKKVLAEYMAIIRAKVATHEILIASARHYAESDDVVQRFACAPLKWLNEERWLLYPDTTDATQAKRPNPDVDWRPILARYAAAGGRADAWPTDCGLRPEHHASRVPAELLSEFGLSRW